MIEGHGDDYFRYGQPIRVNFSSNLTDWIDPIPLVERLREGLGRHIGLYPHPKAERVGERLASRLRIDRDELCITAGATAAIYLVAQALPHRRSYIVQPTFSEYADACRMNGHEVKSIYHLSPSGDLPSDAEMVWMCQPNNPTGGVMERAYLLWLIDTRPEVTFVIDLSYEAFTMHPLLRSQDVVERRNVVTLHSLTKRYGIPGLRVGYFVANRDLARHISLYQQPWACNAVAQEAVSCLLSEPGLIPFDLAGCLSEATRLRTNLVATGAVDVWESQTHFMLCRLRVGQASALKEYLVQEYGMLIRDASNFAGLDGSHFRISAQRPKENDGLVEAVKKFISL